MDAGNIEHLSTPLNITQPHAKQDGKDIKPSERIAAAQAFDGLQRQLRAELAAEGVDVAAAGARLVYVDTCVPVFACRHMCCCSPRSCDPCVQPPQLPATESCEDDGSEAFEGEVAESGYVDEAGELRRPWCPATRILEHREAVSHPRRVWSLYQ